MTSGSRGYHVVVLSPARRNDYDYDARVLRVSSPRSPNAATQTCSRLEQRKANREGKILLDMMRNDIRAHVGRGLFGQGPAGGAGGHAVGARGSCRTARRCPTAGRCGTVRRRLSQVGNPMGRD